VVAVILPGGRDRDRAWTVVNLVNREALYNFISTFSGTIT
jgi:hypothetical protein